MNMKWNPIVDGDLSGIPRDEDFLFTVFDEEDGETYVTTAWVEEDEWHTGVTNGMRSYEVKSV